MRALGLDRCAAAPRPRAPAGRTRGMPRCGTPTDRSHRVPSDRARPLVTGRESCVITSFSHPRRDMDDVAGSPAAHLVWMAVNPLVERPIRLRRRVDNAAAVEWAMHAPPVIEAPVESAQRRRGQRVDLPEWSPGRRCVVQRHACRQPSDSRPRDRVLTNAARHG
jgi:hypothetical protein